MNGADNGPAFTITWQANDADGSFPLSLQYRQQNVCNAEKVEVYVNTEPGTAYILDRSVVIFILTDHQTFDMRPRSLSTGVAPFEVTISNAEVTGSSDVELTVTGENCPGIAALRFHADVPEGFPILSVQASKQLESIRTSGYNDETGIITWYDNCDQTLNGEPFIIKLRKNGTAEFPADILQGEKNNR